MSGSDEDQKPTLQQLYWLLRKNSRVWRSIGARLKFDKFKMDDIEGEFKPAGALSAKSNRCLDPEKQRLYVVHYC